jgi:uncharacterized protein YecE (DUF72 family)
MESTMLYLGTSSWTAVGWETAFYPPKTKKGDFLPYYASRFNSVEIDSTFYRIPTAKTVQQWRERTPESFVFAAKIPQSITHEKVLVSADDDLKAFLDVMDLLGPKLGPLLIQLPYFNKEKFNGLESFLRVLEPFLSSLPKDHQWTVEIRNKNWLGERFFSVLRVKMAEATGTSTPSSPQSTAIAARSCPPRISGCPRLSTSPDNEKGPS